MSKVTIYKKMDLYKKELKGHLKKQKGITFLDEEAIELIKASLVENGVIRSELESDEDVKTLAFKIAELNELSEALEEQFGESVLDNIKDLELISDFLDNQLTMKQSLLIQKDEQLKKYKEMIAMNKERIKSLEGLIQTVQAIR